MKSDMLLNLARPHLAKNDLGVGHTERVLHISRMYFQRPNGRDKFVDAIAILHDVGGPTIKEQYENGPRIARDLMEKLQFSEKEIQEACEIIGTHHNRVKNPTEEYAILYDSDQMVKLTPEEFPIHETEGTNWEKVIENMYHQSSKNMAREWLSERRAK
jgi:HD superfamily phosphodiesterase